MNEKRFGAQSMTDPLHRVLVKTPGAAFGGAFDDPAFGYLHAVDLDLARRQHDAFLILLADLGVRIDELGAENDVDPDLVYVFDPALVSDRGMIPLRSGKPNRLGEEAVLEAWANEQDIPIAGRVQGPGTVDGGDTFWLRPDVFCIGRSLRTNREGARQLADIVGAGSDVHDFDVPYGEGPEFCLHLLSLISPVADDLAAVYLPLLPTGLFELLVDHGVGLVPVPAEEYDTLGCNILAVRPGVLIVVDGNPTTRRMLEARGCEVHAFDGSEICRNGSGGPTCLTRPILRTSGEDLVEQDGR
jgi:N-dimethylarginine dimethylaminohydrolase